MFLAYVLAALGLLSAIAVSVLTASSTSYRLSLNALEAAQLEAAVDAGLARAVLGLLDPRPDERWRVDGTPRDFAFGRFQMRVAIQDELGRIDLNHADHGLLAGLFRSAGLDVVAASGVVDKILDWREPGAGKRPSGAQLADYRAAGLAHVPRNGAFQSVEELRLVLGITPELFGRVSPALTVYSGRPLIDPQFAPREALAALPGGSEFTAAAAVAARKAQGARAGIIPPGISLRGRAFGVRFDVARSDGVTVTREVTIRLTDQEAQPYWVLSWRTR
jgi:general secretion pathway protein K